MNDELLNLLLDIQEWMRDNDYECGEVGSDIYVRISAELRADGVDKNSKKIKNDLNK